VPTTPLPSNIKRDLVLPVALANPFSLTPRLQLGEEAHSMPIETVF
jgi:hypothetical protein